MGGNIQSAFIFFNRTGRKLFYFDPSKVLTGGVIFILPCLLLGLHLSDAFAEEFDTV